MPFTPPLRRISDAENKLRLLCCVDALGSVPQAQLWPFVASLSLMEYMPMQLLLHELLAGGDLETGVHALQDELFVSDQGRETLRLFSRRVLPTDRERIGAAAPTFRAQLLEHSQVRAVYELAKPGEYRVLLELKDGELPTLCIRLLTPVREMASHALHAFAGQASAILGHLYALPAAARASGFQPVSPIPGLVTHSPHEHTLTADLIHENAQFSLSLLLPDLQSAHAYWAALQQPSIAQATAQRLWELLCQ